MAVLLAAGVPCGRWLRFVAVAVPVQVVVGIAGIIAALVWLR